MGNGGSAGAHWREPTGGKPGLPGVRVRYLALKMIRMQTDRVRCGPWECKACPIKSDFGVKEGTGSWGD